MIEEIWKSLKYIQENGDYYEVSNFGNVRSVDKTIYRNNSKPYFKKGKILKQIKNRNGYMVVSLKLNGKEKKCEVQRLVAKAFIPNTHNKLIVNHIDSNKVNNFVENLEWVTQTENIIHAQENGRKNDSGINHYLSKLTNEDVDKIRVFYKNNVYNLRELSEIFEMSVTAIWKIVNYKTHQT